MEIAAGLCLEKQIAVGYELGRDPRDEIAIRQKAFPDHSAEPPECLAYVVPSTFRWRIGPEEENESVPIVVAPSLRDAIGEQG